MIKRNNNNDQHGGYDGVLGLINEMLHQYHHQLLPD